MKEIKDLTGGEDEFEKIDNMVEELKKIGDLHTDPDFRGKDILEKFLVE